MSSWINLGRKLLKVGWQLSSLVRPFYQSKIENRKFIGRNSGTMKQFINTSSPLPTWVATLADTLPWARMRTAKRDNDVVLIFQYLHSTHTLVGAERRGMLFDTLHIILTHSYGCVYVGHGHDAMWCGWRTKNGCCTWTTSHNSGGYIIINGKWNFTNGFSISCSVSRIFGACWLLKRMLGWWCPGRMVDIWSVARWLQESVCRVALQ